MLPDIKVYMLRKPSLICSFPSAFVESLFWCDGWLDLILPNLGHFPNQWLWGYPQQRCGGGCISIRAVPPRLHQASPANPPLWSADQCWQCWRGQAKAPALAPAHPAPPSLRRPSAPDRPDTTERGGAADRGPQLSSVYTLI